MKHFFFFLSILISFCTTAQQKEMSASEIQLEMQKLNVLGKVLYIAAHPDDENTRLISWLANEKKAETAYLSLTRGDGGQNLIGTEKGALMGVLRTQELMEARKIDGGKQFFTRAVDFGYSKTSEETLEKWGRGEVLSDIVYVIRKFKPDVMITRFPPDNYGGHGHHSASAILAEEAFDAAADSSMFPEQLKNGVTIWQAKRLMFNSSSWWDKDLPEKAKGNDDYITIDIGQYNSLLGKSYSEIASESRSQHKSQGFGSGKSRGSQIEYLKFVKGEKPTGNDLFTGIDITWNRIAHIENIPKLVDKAVAIFQPLKLASSIEGLLKINHAMNTWWSIRVAKKPVDIDYMQSKQAAVKELILACAGIWLEVVADDYSATRGDEVKITAEGINRSATSVILKNITMLGNVVSLDSIFNNNKMVRVEQNITIPANYNYTNPYWLNAPYENLFAVKGYKMLGKPEQEPAIEVKYELEIEGDKIEYTRPILYRWTDRVEGELYRPFVVLPKLTLGFDQKNYLMTAEKEYEIAVVVKAHTNNMKGLLTIGTPAIWGVSPSNYQIDIPEKGQEKRYVFKVTPNEKTLWQPIQSAIRIAGQEYEHELIEIEYSHIQTQSALLPATANLVRFNLQKKGEKIGYIMGAGDDVPDAITQMGYAVELIEADAIGATDLTQYDAIVAGIRAYNTKKEMSNAQGYLMEYVKEGGNYIVQYNTNRGIDKDAIGPYSIQLSRDRVTVEDAPVTFLNEKHPILNLPNKITQQDFDGWVQERGLYFANEWDDNYTPLLSWADPGEDDKEGSLLVANYGKGTFIFTGISFFRELPAGVPGAYRLFANLLSYSQRK